METSPKKRGDWLTDRLKHDILSKVLYLQVSRWRRADCLSKHSLIRMQELHYFLSQKKNHLDVWDYKANQGRRTTRDAYN
ncbi:hypothetical protein IGI41_000211 [Enterococcus sp. DIV0876]